MPVLNEEKHLRASVQGVIDQNYPGELQIVLAVGPSKDATEELAQALANQNPRVEVIANPTGKTPAGLNLAIAAASHDIIVRVDAHGVLGDNYLTTAVRKLRETGAANVGGLMDARGETAFEQAVAAAYNSPFGLGGGSFHLESAVEGPAETVFLGSFRKPAILDVGGFDLSLHRAQDWDLNFRLRESGYQVWLTPQMRVYYRPRSTAKALARQFFKTGQWRREVIRRNPQTVRTRYLVPPAAVLTIASGTGFWAFRRFFRRGRRAGLGLLTAAGYLAAVICGSAAVRGELPAAARLRLPLVLTIMHLSWGLGFLKGLSPRDRETQISEPQDPVS